MIEQHAYHLVEDPAIVREVLHHPATFSPANALIAVRPLTPASLRVLNAAGFELPATLASNGSSSHAGIRKVVASFFTPAKVAAVEPRIRELARAASAQAARLLAADGSVDLVDAIASRPPAVVMLELLDVDDFDVEELKGWSRDSLELFWGWPDDERQLLLARSAADYYHWLRRLVVASTSEERPDLFGALGRHGLTTTEICSLAYFLLIAGHETTTQLVSTILFRLAEDPVRWTCAATASGATEAVRQVLATESSVHTWRRVTTRAVDLDGDELPPGAEILLSLTGHPGDEATAYSLAFGSGIHRCLGARLAEREAAILVEEACRAVPVVELDDPSPQWLRLLSFQAPREVVVQSRRPAR